eukprot:TRINITY_DN9492_c0_g3_i6.p1 TRINITY_DN9492_c0_g3~~TRINITY_DN9492_c0_g3_i6.p1  ORF type:complete len:941 (-),score=187.85 TRINITY_DN9492_c0_g3_i6:66-2888(-)
MEAKDSFTPVRIPFTPEDEITSICSSDDKVYIGTIVGTILVYKFVLDENERQKYLTGQLQPIFTQENEIQLKRAPIITLEVWPDKEILFSLSSGVVQVWNAINLNPKVPIGCPDKVKLMASDSIAKSNKIAIHLGKQIQVYVFTGSGFQSSRIIDLPDMCTKMVFQGNTIAVSFKNTRKYGLVDTHRGNLIELMNSGRGECEPCLAPAGIGDTSEEFLICQETKALFIEKSGSPTRQKITFSIVPLQMTVMRPFVLVLGSMGLEVANIFSGEKPKVMDMLPSGLDKIHQGSRWIVCYHGHLLVCLLPLPWHELVHQLIQMDRPTDAIKLLNIYMVSLKGTDFKKRLREIQISVGNKFFEQCDFENAFKYYKLTDINPREVISYFPEFNIPSWGLTPKSVHELIDEFIAKQSQIQLQSQTQIQTSTQFQPQLHPQIQIQSLSQSGKHQGHVVLNRAQIYVNLLELMKDWLELSLQRFLKSPIPKADVDVTLLKIYSQLCPEKVIPFMKSISIPPGSTDEYFRNTQKWGPLALIYVNDGKYQEALDLFKKMAMGQIPIDEGIDYLANATTILSKSTDWTLIKEYAPFIGALNQQCFRSIFMNKVRPHNQLNHDQVMQFLKPYGVVEREYLDFIVNVSKTPDPKYHILLANLQLQHLMHLLGTVPESTLPMIEVVLQGKQNVELDLQSLTILKSRQNLIHLLKTSNHYDPHTILAQIENYELNEEKILLYQRLEMHDKALHIIVHQMNDLKRAELYCLSKINTSEDEKALDKWKDPSDSNPLLFSLLTVLLSSLMERDSVPTFAIDLINKYPEGFDPVAVLKILPPTVPLNKITRFLKYSLKNTTHRMHQAQVVKSLESAQHLKLQLEKMKLEEQKVFVTQMTTCAVTNQPIGDKPFVRYPNGVVVTYAPSVNRNVCPLTGRDFREKPYVGVVHENVKGLESK